MTNGERAVDIAARLTPSERDALAVMALDVLLAHDLSLSDLTHREHVWGVINGAAPTFARVTRTLITNARKARARQPFRDRRAAS